MAAMLSQYVYFLQQGETGPIKIGFTTKLKHRFAVIRSSNIYVSVLGVMPGGRKEERQIHKRFKEHRIEGEWFYPVDEIVQLAKSLPLPHDLLDDLLTKLPWRSIPPEPKLVSPPKPLPKLKTPEQEQRSESLKRWHRLAKQQRLEKINRPVTVDEIHGPLEKLLEKYRPERFVIHHWLKPLGLELAKQACDLTREHLLKLGWVRVLTDHGHGAVAEHFTPPPRPVPLAWSEAYRRCVEEHEDTITTRTP